MDPEALAKAVESFKDTPGAMGANGPLRQVLKGGKLRLNANPSLRAELLN